MLQKAEEIAVDTVKLQKDSGDSGIDARNYYARFGYEREGPFMA